MWSWSGCPVCHFMSIHKSLIFSDDVFKSNVYQRQIHISWNRLWSYHFSKPTTVENHSLASPSTKTQQSGGWTNSFHTVLGPHKRRQQALIQETYTNQRQPTITGVLPVWLLVLFVLHFYSYYSNHLLLQTLNHTGSAWKVFFLLSLKKGFFLKLQNSVC